MYIYIERDTIHDNDDNNNNNDNATYVYMYVYMHRGACTGMKGTHRADARAGRCTEEYGRVSRGRSARKGVGGRL